MHCWQLTPLEVWLLNITLNLPLFKLLGQALEVSHVQLQPTLLKVKPLHTTSALWAPVRPKHTLFFCSPEAFLLP